MKNVILCFMVVVCSFTHNARAQTKVIAHRGFWKTEGSAQNSITALLKADSIGCYGSEFDVWLTSDGELVVNHDSSFNGIHMEKKSAEEITNLKLANDEHLPTLQQYFEAAQKTTIKLILELKRLNTPELETETVKKIIAMAKIYNLDNRIEYISFSQHATEEFIRLSPKGTPVYYLNGNLDPQQLKAMGCAGPDYNLKIFKQNPQWIVQCHELGLKVNVWTVNSIENMEWCIQHKIDFITTDEPIALQNLLAH